MVLLFIKEIILNRQLKDNNCLQVYTNKNNIVSKTIHNSNKKTRKCFKFKNKIVARSLIKLLL